MTRRYLKIGRFALNIVKSEEYRGFRINIWELYIPRSVSSVEEAQTNMRLYVFVDDENITEQLDMIDAGPDDLMRNTKALIDSRLAGNTKGSS